MPTFNPSFPQQDSELVSLPFRNQFNALKEEIDAIPDPQQGAPGEKGDKGDAGEPGPAGPAGADSTVPGPQGPEGRSVVNVRDNGDGRVVVDMNDGTSYGPFYAASGAPGSPGPQGERGNDGTMGGTGPMGSPGSDGISVVNVYDSGDGRAIVQLSNGQTFGPFYVASGPAGSAGERGSDGSPGAPGVDGRILTMRGDWDSSTSYNPGDLVAYNGNVYVALYSASDTPPDVDGRWRVMTITGPAGGQGPAGNDGSPGPQGPQGEVSAQQLNDAINSAIGTAAASSSANTNAVQTLDTYADLPTAISKLNELINALRR